jgi:tripartite-type tricarboxylate transporter receptor subunit TctC
MSSPASPIAWSSELQREQTFIPIKETGILMNISRRSLIGAFTAAPVATVLPALSQAQAGYPDRPVKVVVPFPPGGATDVDGRIFTAALGPALGGTLVIENLPGASGVTGTASVARSKPDGYTLMVGNISTHAIAAGLYEKLPYSPLKAFEPLAHTGKLVNVLVVHPSLNIKSVQELIAYAKKNPGKLSYGSAGIGGTPHLCGELFKLRTQTSMVHVPYKGGGPMLADLLGGHIDLAFANIPDLIPHIKEGKLVALGVTSKTRWPGFELPTIAEQGVADYDVTSWIGLFAPTGIPASVRSKLIGAAMDVQKSASLRNAMTQANIVLDPMGGDDFRSYVSSQLTFWSSFLKQTGIRADV